MKTLLTTLALAVALFTSCSTTPTTDSVKMRVASGTIVETFEIEKGHGLKVGDVTTRRVTLSSGWNASVVVEGEVLAVTVN